MPYEIKREIINPRLTAHIRTTIQSEKLGEALGELLPEIYHYLSAQEMPAAGPPYARYHSYGEAEIDLEVGFPVPEPVETQGRIKPGQLPGGTVVEIWHIGPYDTLQKAYEALETWIEEHGQESASAPWEVYWTDPGEVPNPAEWKTQVLWPIKPGTPE